MSSLETTWARALSMALAGALSCASPSSPSTTRASSPGAAQARPPSTTVTPAAPSSSQAAVTAPSTAREDASCSPNCVRARELANEGDQHVKIDVDGAIERYERAIELDPTNHLILWKLANAWQKKDDFEHVRTVLARALEIAPHEAKYHRLLGQAELMLARDRAGNERATEALKRCIAEDPTIAPCHALLGDAERAIGELDAAIQSYIKAKELEPRAATYLSLAELYVARGDAERAESVIQEGLSAVPPDARQLHELFLLGMLRAELARKRGDKPRELSALQAAAPYAGSEFPEDAFALGSAYSRLGPAGRDEARKHLTRFWKRACRGGAAARFEKECVAANALMQKL